MSQLRSSLNDFASENEQTRQRSMMLIEEKASEIERNSSLAHAKINELHDVANRTISSLTGRVDALKTVAGTRGLKASSVIRAGLRTWCRRSTWPPED